MKRYAIIIAAVAVVVGALGYAAFYQLTRSGMPLRSGERTLPGLQGPVEVRWDGWGVPHLLATSDVDLAAAMGWLHANDRLVQMELGRRLAGGRLAEIIGPVALPSDRHYRSLGFPQLAERMVAAMGPESRQLLEAYAAGVNAWLTEREGDLPPELRLLGLRPDPWQLVDSMYFQLLMQHELSFWNARPEEARFQLLRALGPERLRDLLGDPELRIDPEILALAERTPVGGPAAATDVGSGWVAPEAPGAAVGSNNWALGATRTTTGAPIVANDPHLPLRLPGFWYQAMLRGPGYEAAGVTLAGFPFVVLGRGPGLAWAFTNVMLDDHDLFFEQLDDTGERVRRGDGWLELRREVTRIPLPGGEFEEMVVRWSDLGVLLEADPARGLPARSLAWTAADPGDSFSVLLQLPRSRSVDQLVGQLDEYIAPAQNLVAADSDGGLLYTAIGRVPARPLGDGRVPVPAWNPAYRWDGLLEQASNPTRLRPVDELIVTANHDIRGREDMDRPYPLTADFDTPHRADRIRELLKARTDWTAADMGPVQDDVVSRFATEFVELLASEPLDGDAARARDLLSSWDGGMRGPGAPALAEIVARELIAAIFGDEAAAAGLQGFAGRAELLRALRGSMADTWFDDVRTEPIEDRMATVQKALDQAWAAAVDRWGEAPARWDWSELHSLELQNPLGTVPLLGGWFNRGPIPLPGSATTIAAFGGRWQGERYPVLYGPSMRLISDLANPDGGLVVLPAGQSGHPADPHYDDQLPLYLRGELRPLHWTERAIIDATRATLVLQPRER